MKNKHHLSTSLITIFLLYFIVNVTPGHANNHDTLPPYNYKSINKIPLDSLICTSRYLKQLFTSAEVQKDDTIQSRILFKYIQASMKQKKHELADSLIRYMEYTIKKENLHKYHLHLLQYKIQINKALDTDKALNLTTELLQKATAQHDTEYITTSYFLYSRLYEANGQIDSALYFLLKRYSIDSLQNNYREMSNDMWITGSLMDQIGDSKTCLIYMKRSLDFALKSGNKGRIQNSMVNYGMALLHNNQRKKGFAYLFRCINNSDSLTYNITAGPYTLLQISRALLTSDSLKLGFQLINKAYNLSEKTNRTDQTIQCGAILCQYLNLLHRHHAVIPIALQCYQDAKAKHFPQIIPSILEELITAYQHEDKFEQALYYAQLRYEHKQMLTNDAILKKTNELEKKLRLNEHLYQIKNLAYHSSLQSKKIIKQRIIIVAGALILFILMTGLSLLRYKNNKLQFAHKALVKLNLETLPKPIHKAKKSIKNSSTKNKTSTERHTLIKQMNELFEQEELYTKQNLSQKMVADQLNTNTSYLSRAVNEVLQTNFSQYINQQRIQKACILLASPEFIHYSIEGIATEVGFNSKSSFNIAFKRITGLTPTEFKNNLPEQDSIQHPL